MSGNRIEQYLQDEPTSCPECEAARRYYLAAKRDIAKAALINIGSRRTLRTAVRYLWYTGLALFAHVCVALWIILGR